MLPARIGAETLRRLDRHAKRLGKPRSNLVERYVVEGLRMDEHPGIVFVDGPAGPPPALRRWLDILEVIGPLLHHVCDLEENVQAPDLHLGHLAVALAYFAYP